MSLGKTYFDLRRKEAIKAMKTQRGYKAMKAFWALKDEVYSQGMILPFAVLTAFETTEEAIKRLDRKSFEKGEKLLNAQAIPTNATDVPKSYVQELRESLGLTD